MCVYPLLCSWTKKAEANIIRKIFEMFDKGITVYTIAKHLNSLPLAERIKEKWQMPTIERMLTNISYTGALRYNYRSYTSKKVRVINGEKDLVLVENHHPAIITSEQFAKGLWANFSFYFSSGIKKNASSR